MRPALLIVALAVTLGACGKKGPPSPPGPPDQVIYPNTIYPKPEPFPTRSRPAPY